MKKTNILFLVCVGITFSHRLECGNLIDKIMFWKEQTEETLSHTQKITSGTKITVINEIGNITIKTGSAHTMVLQAIKEGTDTEVAHTRIETLCNKQNLSIKTIVVTRNEQSPMQQCLVNYTLTIPADTEITLVKTDKGSIFLENITTPVTAQTQYGSITGKNISNSIHASTKYGSITINAKDLKPTHKLVAVTERGAIKIQLPAHANATLCAKTDRGTIVSEHAVTLEPRTMQLSQSTFAEMKKDIRGSLGQGGASIKLHTSRGNVKVVKA